MVENPKPLNRKLGLLEFNLAAVLHPGFLKKLDNEGVKITNFLADVENGYITDPEEILKIRQQSHDWREKVTNFWLKHEIPRGYTNK